MTTWDDDERWELIDSVRYNMTQTPGTRHQVILGNLLVEFANLLRGKPYHLYIGPLDVRLPKADESDDQVDTVVQPDLLIICDPKKLDDAGCRGAPDLIVEILTPLTAGKDLKLKFEPYERAGVREYWIVWPVYEVVQVYSLGGNGTYGRPAVYDENNQTQVGIFPELMIDLSVVFGE